MCKRHCQTQAIADDQHSPVALAVTRNLQFSKPSVAQGDSVEVIFSIVSHFPQPIGFSRYCKHCATTNTWSAANVVCLAGFGVHDLRLILQFDQPKAIGFGTTTVIAGELPFENALADNQFVMGDTQDVSVESLILLPQRTYTFRFQYHVPYTSTFTGRVEV
jgi:hypothetical protein